MTIEDREALLYPASEPFHRGLLPVGDGHALAYQQYGRSDGVPVVYLHGGPGAGTEPYYHRYFDPSIFHIVTYDQRGAPLSPPEAFRESGDPRHLIEANSPEHLVADHEALRLHLGLEAWHIFGGSWGATLALLYAEEFPQRTMSLTLRGVFMMRAEELQWYLHGTRTFYPEVHREFLDFIPEGERDDLARAYYTRLTDPDPKVHLAAASAWTRYENGYSFLDVPPDEIRNDRPEKALPFALIEAYYMHRFMPTNQIMEQVHAIRELPTHIVQGRHDCCCPPMSAYDLSRELTKCSLEFTQAGHSGGMTENVRGLVAATDRIKATGSPVLPDVGARY